MGRTLSLPRQDKWIRRTMGNGCQLCHPSRGKGRSRAENWGWTCVDSRARGAALSWTSLLENCKSQTICCTHCLFFCELVGEICPKKSIIINVLWKVEMQSLGQETFLCLLEEPLLTYWHSVSHLCFTLHSFKSWSFYGFRQSPVTVPPPLWAGAPPPAFTKSSPLH